MREEDWRTIIALHEYRNLTKAADSMYVSQPTLTKQLHRIENEFGIRVVERSNRGVSFTPEGEYLAERARLIMDDIMETKRVLAEMSGGAEREAD